MAEEATFFHTPDGESFATVPVGGHQENWSLRSRQFKQWMLRAYYLQTKSAPQNSAVQEALGVLESRAQYDGDELPVFVRMADIEGKIILDLCNDRWEAVEIDAAGWRVLSNVPVKFRRSRGMGPLPRPTEGESIDQLRGFVNVARDSDWILLVAWLIAALRPRGPFPILVLQGEQGSAKSTTNRVLRDVVDPNTASIRGVPRNSRDLAIAASNSWMISLDNISYIPPWISDNLCMLSTGGAFATRELYSDREEALFDAKRPIVLNGIEDLVVRGDLLDRAIILELPSIQDEKRRSELSFWTAFEASRPAILGALLDAISCALRRLPKIKLAEKPRMADFAMWATAAEPALGWDEGAFIQAYTRSQASSNQFALDASPIAEPLRNLISNGEFEQFQGTATDLLKALNSRNDESIRRQKGWPQNGQGVSNAIRRLIPNLRRSGIEVRFSRSTKRNRRRLITIRNIASEVSEVSAASESTDLERRRSG